MPKHLGNLTVTAENALSFPAITELYGHLTIAAGATLIAPSLTLVRGWLTLWEGATLKVDNLGGIDGWVTLRNMFLMHAPSLTVITEDLVRYAGALNASRLTSVGSLQVQRGVETAMTPLTEVKRSITLAPDSWLTAANLQKVGGSITLKEEAKLDTPELSHIGGYADIDESAVLLAPRFLS